MMRILAFAIVLMSAFSTPMRADTLKVAVFDLELFDTSLEGEKNGPQADEQARLLRTSDQLRKGLSDSGKFLTVDITLVQAEAHGSNLQACGGCDVKLARQLGADFAITGVVQKISILILNMNVFVRDAHTGTLVSAVNADFRGNTDESWSRAMSYLLRNRLLAPNYGAQK